MMDKNDDGLIKGVVNFHILLPDQQTMSLSMNNNFFLRGFNSMLT